MATVEEILDSWSKAHKEITDAWLAQGKPKKVKCWGQLLDFNEAHNNLSKECNRQLFNEGYLELEEDTDPPEWAIIGNGKKFSNHM